MFNVTSKAKAKLVKNNKLQTVRLVVAFNVYDTDARGQWKFPVQSKCDYVSGDIQPDEVFVALDMAKQHLSTQDVELVA